MIAICIGCGCSSDAACEGGCYWTRLDRAAGLGVCSNCEDHEARFDAGERSMSDDDSRLLLPGDDDFGLTLDLLDQQSIPMKGLK